MVMSRWHTGWLVILKGKIAMTPNPQHRGAKYGSWKLVKSIGSGGAGARLK